MPQPRKLRGPLENQQQQTTKAEPSLELPVKAAESGDVEAILAYLESGGSVDARGKRQRTLLHLAARYDRVAVAQVLLERGANTEAITAHKVTPLHLTAFYECPKTMALLLQHGAQSEAGDFGSWRALHYACNHGSVLCARQLIDFGVSINFKSAELQFAPIHLGERPSACSLFLFQCSMFDRA